MEVGSEPMIDFNILLVLTLLCVFSSLDVRMKSVVDGAKGVENPSQSGQRLKICFLIAHICFDVLAASCREATFACQIRFSRRKSRDGQLGDKSTSCGLAIRQAAISFHGQAKVIFSVVKKNVLFA